MHRLSCVLALTLLAASSASAGVLEIRSEPTPGLTGFETYTFAMRPEGDEVFRGIDARFRGPMNQLNPFGVPTIFNDDPTLLGVEGIDFRQDSHFLFSTTQFQEAGMLSIATEELSDSLGAAITGIHRLGLPGAVDFAQVVTDRPGEITVDLDLDLNQGGVLTYGTEAASKTA